MGDGVETMLENYSLLINAGVAGVFAAFAIVMIREFMKFLSEQSTMWRAFIKEETDERTKIMKDTNKKMVKLDETLEELCTLVKASNGKRKDAI